jgi:hypothetical protein
VPGPKTGRSWETSDPFPFRPQESLFEYHRTVLRFQEHRNIISGAVFNLTDFLTRRRRPSYVHQDCQFGLGIAVLPCGPNPVRETNRSEIPNLVSTGKSDVYANSNDWNRIAPPRSG